MDQDGGKEKKGNAATPSLIECANCGAAEGTVAGVTVHRPCSRCKITFYCSVKCQKHHWKVGGHRKHCVAPEERRVAMVEMMETSRNKSKRGSGAAAAAPEDDGVDECTICLEALSKSPSKQLPCSHVYHVACVEKLQSYDIQQVCPTCRTDLPPGPEQLWEEAVRRFVLLGRHYGQGDDKPWCRITKTRDRHDVEELVRMVRDAAEQGDARAQALLGAMYIFGQGLPQNDALAVEWFRKAADQGYASAQYNIGLMYHDGKGGLPQSDAMAVEWYRKAADQGTAQAQHNLGCMYEQGKGGLPQSDAMAVEWFRKAADQGYADAQVNLGIMYAAGRGALPQSGTLAVEWFRKAADQGDAMAHFNLGVAYEQGRGVPQSDIMAAEWYHKAAEQGHVCAQSTLGFMFQLGIVVEQNDAKSAEWWRKAADQGSADATCNLAGHYAYGTGGLPRDLTKALELLRKAEALGNDKAKARIAHILDMQVCEEETGDAGWLDDTSLPSASAPPPSLGGGGDKNKKKVGKKKGNKGK